ncbi:MAG: hypothetical protein JWM57_3629, partial [Phycisphaerales bacterium]|nr:hypothetical protein [Phycisphaerales bacterium]
MNTFSSTAPYRVALLGCPSCPDVPWATEHIERLQAHGFNSLQLNLAWGYRPADEALNLEDVVEIPPGDCAEFEQPVPLRSDPSAKRFAARREALRQRIALCQATGMRSIFHFGAPYNAHQAYGDNPPNCLLDGRTPERYIKLLHLFAEQFPGVDDLWLYTYDQDAWLCSEFGLCPRCAGIPLHETVTGFVNRIGKTWNQLRPGGRVWWEPWELSAGQVFRAVPLLDTQVTGLALHSNVAEVMAAQPVDRWLKVVSRLAQKACLPLIVEHVFSSATEELGAYLHIPCPQLLLRALRAISALPISGVKEYYGLLPDRYDPNLELTGLFLQNPDLDDTAIMQRLATPYGDAAGVVIAFWDSVSDAFDLFPWSATWFLREFSRCDPRHGMGAAFIRGQQAHTPSWESS